MAMREELINLCDTNNGYVDEVPADKFADYLITNGVTIPVLCKDCKKWLKCEPSGTSCRVCADTTKIRLPYDFCSRGERRNSNE